MKRQILVAILSLGMILLSLFPETANAQGFTWFAAGSRPQDYVMGGDPTVSHGSPNGGYIRSIVSPINGFGTYMANMASNQYLGSGIRLSAYVRTVDVANWSGLWMRVDGPGGTLSFDNMGTRPITGTTNWQRYEVILDVPENASNVALGILLSGTGEAEVDGLRVERVERTWVVQNTGTSEYIASIKAVDENTAWAGADHGVYLRTTDGGSNWTSGTISGAGTLVLYSIAAIDHSTAFYLAQNFNGSDGRIYKTSDGGVNWTLQYQNTSPGVFFNTIAFWDSLNGLAVGDPLNGSFVIVTTTNGGADWNQVPAANIPPPLPGEWGGVTGEGGTSLAVKGTRHAWFGTGNASPLRVLKSSDKGATWTVANTPLSATGQFYGIQTVAFRDSLNGFAGSTRFPYETDAISLAKTTDGGNSWSAVSSFLPIYPSNVVFVPQTNDSVLFVTSAQGSAYSQDGGATWRLVNTARFFFAMSFAGPTVGWAGGPNGVIAKFAGNLITAVNQQTSERPITFGLEQNYPNPFNPGTTIRFQIPEVGSQRSDVGLVTLKVYDLLGREVATLVNERKEPGSYQVEFNGKDLASGVYLYRLQAGNFVETRKMLLVK